ncbi:hypothetical protein [Desulfosarcina ovata]|uniref:MotA/TolQ/ExbB proton channel domain-containing protein n=1 Tax=Desulfosarcina ovata subsp. ovata TaxID=2752305 RepID=A0A5K8AMB9_9BACT|nr:hypothetical protein [Desulfosarcina ovata]BBO92960.1 hypothetical protein DSCOOX_61400 [Desulfosarcina ovata subsp. ovata]
MAFLQWILKNFGLFFGPVFLVYFFLMIRRLIILFDILRHVPVRIGFSSLLTGSNEALFFLDPLFARLATAAAGHGRSVDALIDVIWTEVDCHVSVHFTALHGYVNTLILIGFAGTIFGSIGAFNEMFQGLAGGQAASVVFAASWNNGLATALYTSLGAAVMGGLTVTLLCSRCLTIRAKRLDILVGLKISEIIEEKKTCVDVADKGSMYLQEPRIREKIFLPISSSSSWFFP